MVLQHARNKMILQHAHISILLVPARAKMNKLQAPVFRRSPSRVWSKSPRQLYARQEHNNLTGKCISSTYK